MKIKATKVMAEYINDLAKENNLNLKAIPTLVGSEQIGIDELIYAEDYGDLDCETHKAKAIKILYPYEDYAMPQYITTHWLVSDFRRLPEKSIQAFNKMLLDIIAI